jgi:hypothetical protein
VLVVVGTVNSVEMPKSGAGRVTVVQTVCLGSRVVPKVFVLCFGRAGYLCVVLLD